MESDSIEAVINDDLIYDCLKDQSIWLGESDDHTPNKDVLELRELLVEANCDIRKARTLNCAFRNIHHINHLQGFASLRSLKLDNNQISKIEGLDHLVNLENLDLSFNTIRKIDNLSSLTKLRNLCLSSNQIESIENLDYNTELELLSLSDNQISDLADVEYLRDFKSLRVLNLKANPITSDEDFKNTVFAFLDIEFLDYERVDENDKLVAREEKTEYINAMQQKESKMKEKAMAKQKKDEHTKVLREANLEGVETIFDDMIKDDAEIQRMQLLPEFPTMLKVLEDKFKIAVDRYVREILKKNTRKQKQDDMFRTAYNKLCVISESESRQLLENFDLQRAMQGSNIATFIDETEFELMEIEMHHVEQFAKMVDKYDDLCDDILRENNKASESTFADLTDAEDESFKDLTEKIEKIIEVVQEHGTTKIENALLNETQLEQLHILLDLDQKDNVRQVVQRSHDNHIAHISKIEDIIREREEACKKDKVSRAMEFESVRNRRRCSEIHDLMQRHRKNAGIELETEA